MRNAMLETTAKHDVVGSIWTGDHSELSCAHLNGEWQFHAKSHELIGAFLACPPDWAQGPTLLRDERGLPLPGCRTIVGLPVVWIPLSRLSMFSNNHCQKIHSAFFAHHIVLTDRHFKSESHLPVKVAWFCLIFLHYIFRSQQFPKVK